MNFNAENFFQIFNGSEYDGVLIFNPVLMWTLIGLAIVIAILAVVVNIKSSKVSNSVLDPKTKRKIPGKTLTKEQQATVKKLDIIKYVTFVVSVIVLLLGVKLPTSIFDSTSSVKDTGKFETYMTDVTKVMKSSNGTIEKSGDEYILTQTLTGKLDGKDFKLDGGYSIDAKYIPKVTDKTTKVKAVTVLSKTDKIKVDVDKNALVTDGKLTLTVKK